MRLLHLTAHGETIRKDVSRNATQIMMALMGNKLNAKSEYYVLLMGFYSSEVL